MNISPDSRNAESLEHGLSPAKYFPRVERKSSTFKFVAGIVGAMAALLVLLCAGCQNTATLPKQLTVQMPGVLAVGDVLKLSFSGAPELNQSQRIRSDGKVSLPQIGQVEAAGKKLGEFQDELSRMYKSKLTNTEVVVALESSAIPVYVAGAVNHPGKIVLDRPMTVLEAIMEAGGPSNLGNLKKVIVIRNANGRHYTQTFDLSPPLRGQATGAFYLRPYDMINVPERFF